MCQNPSYILLLPEVALENIFSFLSYDEISKNRIVCKKFNEIGGKLLSRGFIQLEKRNALIYKKVKSGLPRRESERKNHPLARHSDILQGVETRLRKILDEIKSILDLVENNRTPPRTHQLLQELRDLSSMAMEHFDEHILPRCKEQLEQRTGTVLNKCSPEKILEKLEVVAGSLSPFNNFQGMFYRNVASTSKSTRLLFHQQFPHAISNELYKVKKLTKSHKHHICYLTQNTQKLSLKIRKQKNQLHIQSTKIREQERKIQEQEASLNEIRKHVEEWDQKYKDLTAELVRAKDEILLKASTSNSPIMSNPLLTPTSSSSVQNSEFKSTNPSFKSNIKPRVAHILPKSYLSLDFERKRKSSISPVSPVPLKRNRSPNNNSTLEPQKYLSKAEGNAEDVKIVIPQLKTFNESHSASKDEAGSSKTSTDHSSQTKNLSTEKPDVLNTFFANLLSRPLNSVKTRKRKMTDNIDLSSAIMHPKR